jgi:prepilin-type processing-associated H-X9-DG protein/prepilin-type N-terminal cleavage/methylation domain-containing protein
MGVRFRYRVPHGPASVRAANFFGRSASAQRPRLSPPSHPRAFTLVELLVVIAIMGILAALLLAAVSQVKAKALRIQCAHNLGQLGIGLQAFATDYGGYPLALGPTNAIQGYWMSAMRSAELSPPGNTTKRIKFSEWMGQGVWNCPARNPGTSWPTNRFFMSYGYNAMGLSDVTDTNGFLGLGGHYRVAVDWGNGLRKIFDSPVKESEIASPAEMMAIGDGFIGDQDRIQDGQMVMQRTASVTNFAEDLHNTQRSNARHQGKANVVFCDGHVESPTLQFLFADTGDAALARWNRDHLPHRDKL